MKKLMMVVIATAVAITAGFTYVSAQTEANKPEKKMIIGQAVSLAYYAMEGTVSEDMAEAMEFEADKGFPVGIIEEETGDVYIAVYRDNAPASKLQAANEHMKGLFGKKVTAQGLVYEMPNLKVIRISLISEY